MMRFNVLSTKSLFTLFLLMKKNAVSFTGMFVCVKVLHEA